MKFLWALLIAGTALRGQVIEGTVVSSLGGVPIGGASVSIEQGGKPAYQAATDLAGAFRIEGVKDGSYSASFVKKGFQAPNPDAAARRPFRVVAGADPIRLQVQLTPLGTVSGRVLDGDNHPVPGAGIELLIAGSFAGQTDTTGEQGSFRFQNVEPGSYTLYARPPGKLKPPAPAGDQSRGWARTYYPGVLEKEAAARIVVNPGSELPGQDVKLLAVSVHRLSGRVFDAKGDPAPRITVKLAATDEIHGDELQAVSAEDGSFELSALRDGRWRMFAETPSGETKLSAFASVQVMGHDLNGQDLRLSLPFTIRGQVELEPPPGAQEKRPVSLVILFAGGSGFMSGQGSAGEDGSFKIDDVYQGLYRVLIILGPGTREYYLAAVMLGQREVPQEAVELVPGSLPLRIVYKSNGGSVHGTVADCGNATVFLIPQDRCLQELEFVKRTSCQESGRFEISNIRPGDYYAFAFDGVVVSPDVIFRLARTLANRAVSVTVRAGEAGSADLKVTSSNLP